MTAIPATTVPPRLKLLLGALAIAALLGTMLLLVAPLALAQDAAPRGPLDAAATWAFAAAAFATAASSIGAGMAVARVGSAAIGALAEKPELFGRLLIFIGLAEGIAIYGLIVSILILNRIG
jgi:V/A-type H+-transporting ATPase subunit K